MRTSRSLAANSVIRFLTESAVLGFGLVSGVVVARSLGPEGKGTLATLAFLFGVIGQTTPLGVDEASIILIGQRRASLQRALSAALPLMLVSAIVGMGLLVGMVSFQFGLEGSMAWTVVFACTLIPLVGCSFLFTGLLSSQEQIARTSLARMVARGVTLVVLIAFALSSPLTLTRSVAAEALGMAFGAAMLFRWLARENVSFRLSWDPTYLREAVPKGLQIQGGRVISNLADRVDLLFVLAISGRAATGQYSVALTVGHLVSHATFAMTFATFPRMASIQDDEEAMQLTKRACRFGLASALTTALALGAIVPSVLPRLFGDGFTPAVTPALLSLVGGIFWSSQLLLARAWAARGTTQLMLRAYGAGLVVMLALDLWLIPSFGITGAAAASVAGPVVGTIVCIREYKRALGTRFRVTDLIPRGEDFVALIKLPGELLRGR